MKDDAGFYAEFTERRPSASQMAAAKVLDVIARLPGGAGQASDAELSMSACPDLDTSSTIQIGQHLGRISKNSRVPLGRNVYGHPLAGLLWGRQVKKVLLESGWCEAPTWEHRQQGLFISVCVNDIDMAGKKQNLEPMWKMLMNKVPLEKPKTFLDQVYLGCTQRRRQKNVRTMDFRRAHCKSYLTLEKQKQMSSRGPTTGHELDWSL